MTTPHVSPGIAALARVVWMMLGPMALVLTGFAILRAGRGWLTAADIAYLSILAVVLLARWAEFQGGHPETSTGEPATPADLRRFLIVTSTVGLAIWLAVNVVANYWLAP